MDANTQRNLQKIAQEVLGSRLEDPNSKTIQLWEHYIANNVKSVDDFKEFLFSTDKYMELLHKTFEERALFSGFLQQDVESLFMRCVSEHGGNGLRIWHIHPWISKVPGYDAYFSKMVQNVMAYELGTSSSSTPISSEFVAFYVDKFKNDATYDVLTLSKDVIAMEHEQRKPGENDASPQETNDDFAFPDLTTVVVGSGSSPTVLPTPILTIDKDFVDAFETIYQRPMFVQEYFKYGVGATVSPSEQSWPKIYAEHCRNFNQLREIYETYTGKTVSEYYYVNRYLFDVDAPNFFEAIVDKIIESSEYKFGMSKVLCTKYNKMFDTPLNEQDLTYIFDVVKKQRLGVVEDKIGGILTALKEDTDSLVSRILKVYMRVLERPPDMNEIEQYVGFFRLSFTTTPTADDALEKILMRTLEFHDNIKKRIKKEYFVKLSKEVTPSVMFDILNRVIFRIDELTMKNIDEIIGTFICQTFPA